MGNGKYGRPSKLTPEVHDEIVEHIKAGNYIETACAMTGIGRSTYYEWMNKAKKSTRQNRYTKFQDAVRKAKAWAEARDVIIITKHAEKKWQAAAWLLERKHPRRWGRKKQEKQEKKVVKRPVVTPLNTRSEHVPAEDRVWHQQALYYELNPPEGWETYLPGGE